jgi:prolyl-tRNA synthetase
MRQSHLFTKTRKEAPKDEVAKNAELLIRAGYIHKEMAGVYTFLPLGLRTFNNICRIIREEMDKIGGQEVLMTVLQDKTLWETTDRWSDEKVDNWFKTELKVGGEVGLGITHEEPLTRIMTDYIHSYRDLPVMAYQIQEKFRNETRAKSGIMRGREFFMKDMYTFARSEEEHQELYEKVKAAYVKIFERLGLGDRTYVTFAAGGIFSKYSEEFQTVSEAGEDIIYVDEKRGIALNKEVYTDEVIADLGLDKATLVEKKSIETGNIFTLGTRFSDALSLTYTDESGTKLPVLMGCYGLGPSRTMGTIVEVLSDEAGIIWPPSIAPFQVHLIQIGVSDEVVKTSLRLYEDLTKRGIEVLYDDRDLRAGEKFADSDLIGIPYRAIVSEKTIAEGAIEVVERSSGEVTHVGEEELALYVKK